MKRNVYYYGTPGKKYGMYNTVTKKFQFDICEDSPMLAVARLYKLIGDNAKKWRFEPRILPDREAQRLTKTRWIPVKERLPDEQTYDWVLVQIHVGGSYGVPCVAEQRGDGWYDAYDNNIESAYGTKVTHWMPLPTSPKGGSPE